MECNSARQYLSAYYDQTLTDEQQRAVEEHLQVCDACVHELADWRELYVALNDPMLREMVLCDPPPLPDDFTDQVLGRIDAERPTGLNVIWPWLRQRWSRRQYASVAYAMSATLVVVSASNLLFLWNQTTNHLTVWMAHANAFLEALRTNLGSTGVHLYSFWSDILTYLHLG